MKFEPDYYFRHTRRYKNDLEQLPEFGTVEQAVVQAVSTLHRAKSFVKFGFFLEQSEQVWFLPGAERSQGEAATSGATGEGGGAAGASRDWNQGGKVSLGMEDKAQHSHWVSQPEQRMARMMLKHVN